MARFALTAVTVLPVLLEQQDRQPGSGLSGEASDEERGGGSDDESGGDDIEILTPTPAPPETKPTPQALAQTQTRSLTLIR